MAHARPLTGALSLVAVAALPIFLTGSLAPELRRDFPFGDALLGVAVGTFFAASAIASTPAGRLVARIGTAAAVRLTAALTLGCSLGVALLAQSATTLIGLLVIGGLGNALSSPSASAVLTRDVAVEQHGIGYGALTAGAPIGALLAGLALPLVAQPFDWRIAFVAGAALALLTVLAAGVHGDGAEHRTHARLAVSAPGPGGGRWNPVHGLAVAAALASAASTGLISFLVVFSVDSGLSGGEAGALLATTGLAAAISRIGFGMVADRGAARARSHLLALLVLSSAGFLLLLTGIPALIAVGALVAGGLGWGWAGLMNLIAVREGRYDPAEAVGIVMSGLFLGALTGPILIGLIAGSAGFDLAWLLAAASVVAAAATVATARTSPGPDRQNAPR
jgi:MFS family permease